jgi:hypothetical protein
VHPYAEIEYPVLMPSSCFGQIEGDVPPFFKLSIRNSGFDQSAFLSSEMFIDRPDLYDYLLECDLGDPLLENWKSFRTAVDQFESLYEYCSR